MIQTEAWVLYPGNGNGPAAFVKEPFSFTDIGPTEVLAEPLYGCWEGNMGHAVARIPIDICQFRNEAKVILGNAGVVRVLKTGTGVVDLKEGDLCILFSSGTRDECGYMKTALGYDAWGTIGVLAKRHKLDVWQLIPVPQHTKFSLKQWAAFSVRYTTAWANWQAAVGCWRVLSGAQPGREFCVWGWGGGVALSELLLARDAGFRCALIAADPARHQMIASLGITAVDRREFPELYYDEQRCRTDDIYRRRYLNSIRKFSSIVRDLTHGKGVSIFIDNIGLPVYRATLDALACPGVIATAGWKCGMKLTHERAPECFRWHTHVHTHYARREQACDAVKFAEENAWMPMIDEPVYCWDEIGTLARDYAEGKVTSYFPIFAVNSE